MTILKNNSRKISPIAPMKNQARGLSGIIDIRESPMDPSISPQGIHNASTTAVMNAASASLILFSDIFPSYEWFYGYLIIFSVERILVMNRTYSRHIKIEDNRLNTDKMPYTWVEFNKELFEKIAKFDDKRVELKRIVGDCFKKAMGKFEYPNKEMDPFSPVSMMTAFADEKRAKICAELKAALGINASVPSDFKAEPTMNPTLSRFVATENGVNYSNIIWNFFKKARQFVNGYLSEDEFIKTFDESCIYLVKGTKLSMALFWMYPEKYTTLDSTLRNFIEGRYNFRKIEKDFNGETYISANKEINDKLKEWGYKSLLELSEDAWKNPIYFDDYDSGITKEKWIELLSREDDATKDIVKILMYIKKEGGSASCTSLSKKYGNNDNYYRNKVWQYGKKVYEITDCPPPIGESETTEYWPILFTGRAKRKKELGQLIWIIRDEISEALDELNIEESKETNEKVKVIEMDKNIILYGPPGTGKTYSTYKMAVDIIEGNDPNTPAEFKDVKKKYDEYRKQGRIGFVTFHQSYSYEEFIEGIRPKVDESESTLDYELKDGVFKKFCDVANSATSKLSRAEINENPTIWKVSLKGTGDNEVRAECLKNNHIRIGWDEYGEVLTDDMDYFKGGRDNLDAFYNKMSEGDVVLSCYSSKTIDAVGIVTGPARYDDKYDEYKRVRDVEWLKKFTGEKYDIYEMNGRVSMTLSTVYRLNRLSKKDIAEIIGKDTKITSKSEKKYVFIIDEINRGNVSRIFGEMITLMEESKRLGEEEELEITLPYSGKPFGIPSNVYIIGTMNTADRSLVSLDSALRRRFSFVEMLPDYSLITDNCESVDVRHLLKTINGRIAKCFDNEHVIGHSYLMNVNSIMDLKKVFQKKIIPLLQEYFYDDIDNLVEVLAKGADSSESEFIKKGRILDFNDPSWNTRGLYISIYDQSETED